MRPAVKPGLGHTDTWLTAHIISTLPCWRALGATPNILTGLGGVASALSVYALYHRWFAPAVALIAARLYFDFADGLMARTYDMVTVFGDIFDHTSDTLWFVGVVCVFMFADYPRPLKCAVMTACFVFLVLSVVQAGCIEQEYYDTDTTQRDTTISWLRNLCPARVVAAAKYTDSGVFYVVIVVCAAILCGHAP
jgi:phosphatidylglycerophosphate synthase